MAWPVTTWRLPTSRTNRFLVWLFTIDLSSHALTVDAQPVRLSGVIYLGDLPTVVAQHQGLFENYDLDVAVEYNASGKVNLEKLRRGETDFAMMALTPVVLDQLADATPGGLDDPVILACLVHSTQLNQIVALTGESIASPPDLQGRRVALVKGTNAEFLWWLFAFLHGFDPMSVELLDMPIDVIPDALANGDIDAAVIWEPWTSRLQQRLGAGLQSFHGGDVYTAKWVIVTTRRNAVERPDLARNILSAYQDAINLVGREPEQAIRIYSQRTGESEEILRVHWQELDYDLNLDWSIITALQLQLEWARRVGYQTAANEVNILSLIEAAPLLAVEPGAVGISRLPEAESGP